MGNYYTRVYDRCAHIVICKYCLYVSVVPVCIKILNHTTYAHARFT